MSDAGVIGIMLPHQPSRSEGASLWDGPVPRMAARMGGDDSLLGWHCRIIMWERVWVMECHQQECKLSSLYQCWHARAYCWFLWLVSCRLIAQLSEVLCVKAGEHRRLCHSTEHMCAGGQLLENKCAGLPWYGDWTKTSHLLHYFGGEVRGVLMFLGLCCSQQCTRDKNRLSVHELSWRCS